MINPTQYQRISFWFLAAIMFALVLSCQEESVGTTKETLTEEIQVGTDKLFLAKGNSQAFISPGNNSILLASLSLWVMRSGSSPAGSIRLRLVRVSDNANLGQSASVDVASLSNSSVGTKVTWNFAEGYEVTGGELYRIELIPSYSSLTPLNTTSNQIKLLKYKDINYVGGHSTIRVRNTTDITYGGSDRDFLFQTKNYNDSGNIYTDQQLAFNTQDSSNIIQLRINQTDFSAPDGYINGQEFIPLY